ncbi:MAG: hypothetical protein AAF570_07050, partial [Bacteroidota bacterium]
MVQAQCPNDNALAAGVPTALDAGTATPPTSVANTTIWGGEYMEIQNVTAGDQFTVQSCGTASYDSRITVLDPSGTAIGTDGAGCGDDGTLTFTAAVGGTFRALIDDEACGHNTTNSVLTITYVAAGGNCTTSSIQMDPVDVTVTEPAAAAFMADTTGGGPMDSVRWHCSTDGGSSWALVTDASPYSGTATQSFSVNPTASALSGNQYRMVGYCSGTAIDSSGAATLTVNSAGGGCNSVFFEDFETDGEGSRYTSNSYSSGSDYWTRNCNNPHPNAGNAYDNFQGSCAWHFEDVIGANLPAPTTHGQIVFGPYNVAGQTGLEASMMMAVGRHGGVFFGQRWELTDSINVQYSFDGGTTYKTVGRFIGELAFGGHLLHDVNLSGAPDGGDTEVDTIFSNYTFPIPETGTNIQIRIQAFQNGGSEEEAFENVSLCGVSESCTAGSIQKDHTNSSVCPTASATFTADTTGGGPADSLRWHVSTDGGTTWSAIFDVSPYSGTTTGTVSVNPASSGNGNQYRMVAYYCNPIQTDSSAAATLTAVDLVAPTPICPTSPRIYLDASGNGSMAANALGDGSSTDNCGTPTETNALTNVNCTNIPNVSIQLIATDAAFNSSTTTCTVTVSDTLNPTPVCQNVTVFLDGSGNATVAASDVDNGSSDNCGTPTLGLSPTSFVCANAGANTVTLTATDASSNVDSCTATVTVTDSTDPTAVCQNLTVFLDGSGNASITAADVDGGSSDNCGLGTLSVSPSTFTCANVGAATATLTVPDVNGNTSTCTASVTVTDSTDPTAVCQNITVHLDGSGNASITAADVDGGSSDNCTLGTLSVSPSTFTCANVGAASVTLTVPDVNGNSSTCTASVTVNDSTDPTAVCQ